MGRGTEICLLRKQVILVQEMDHTIRKPTIIIKAGKAPKQMDPQVLVA